MRFEKGYGLIQTETASSESLHASSEEVDTPVDVDTAQSEESEEDPPELIPPIIGGVENIGDIDIEKEQAMDRALYEDDESSGSIRK